jgi:hypothetical protein
MMRLLFAPLAALMTLFVVCIGLIHAQPYDNAELRDLLTPSESCPMPCFMGIRPGVTSSYEAVGILERHEWVDEVRVAYHGVTQFPDAIDWTWNGHESSLISYTYDGFPQPGYVGVNDGTVEFVSIPTVVSVGDLWLTWGLPDEFRYTIVQGNKDSSVTLAYVNAYTRHNFWVSGIVPCPYFPAIWREQVVVTIGAPQEMFLPFEPSSPDVSPFVDYMLEHEQGAC